MQSIQTLLRLARPRFLVASLVVFTLGVFWAVLHGAVFSVMRMTFAYLAVAFAQLSVSFSNDYFDYDLDQLGTPSLFSGGSGVLFTHPKWRSRALIIAWSLTFTSIILGAAFAVIYSYPVWFVSLILLSNAIGWCYSAPPFKFAYRGAGEILTAFTFGFLVPEAGLLAMKLSATGEHLLLALPMFCYALAIILIVEIPDMEADRLGGKNTWVVRLGRHQIWTVIAALFFLASVTLFLIAFLTRHSSSLDFRLFPALSLVPLGTAIFAMIRKPVEVKPALPFVYALIASLAVLFILADVILIIAASHSPV